MKKKVKNYRFLTRKLRRLAGKTLYRREMDEKNAIFVHIPKAAGTSVCEAVFGTPNSSHYTARCYRSDNPKKFNRYIKFSVVRNPYDRIISAYSYLLNGGSRLSDKDRRFREHYLSNFDGLNDFVMNGLGREECRQRPHFDPQYEYLFDDDCSTLIVDYVEKIEHMEQFSDHLGRLLGAEIVIDHQNKTKGKCASLELTDQAKQRIYEIYRLDFELLGYDK